jgi:hypothetical protein
VFVPRPDSPEPVFERMTARYSALAPINDPASLYKPIRKVIHRAHAEITVTRGNHALVDSPFAPLRGWFPIEVFHFPLRSLAQCEHKARLQGTAFEKYIARPPTAYHAQMFEALNSGAIADYYGSLVVDDGELELGVAEGRIVVDPRLRDALRAIASGGSLEFETPSLVDEATYAVEAATLGEADVVRLQRRLDTLEGRLAAIELRLPNRIYRKVTAPVKRALRR